MSEKQFTNVSIGMEEAYCDFSIIKVGDKIISDGIPTTDAIRICDLLNELNDENDILKQQLKTKYIVNKQYEELQKLKKQCNEQQAKIKELEKENTELKKQIEDCKDYNSILYKNCLQKDRKWIKEVKQLEDELEECIKENAKLREYKENKDIPTNSYTVHTNNYKDSFLAEMKETEKQESIRVKNLGELFDDE